MVTRTNRDPVINLMFIGFYIDVQVVQILFQRAVLVSHGSLGKLSILGSEGRESRTRLHLINMCPLNLGLQSTDL